MVLPYSSCLGKGALHSPRCIPSLLTLRRETLTEHSSNKRPAPFSVRLSVDERRELVRRAEAAGLSIGGYWKSAVFNLPPPRKSRRPSVDRIELAKLLGQLGRVGNNINQLTRTLNAEGSVEIPELVTALKELTDMRAAIMNAIGYQETSSDFGQDKHDEGVQHHDH